jgi:tetratricopeptide (TPR) repeat protein
VVAGKQIGLRILLVPGMLGGVISLMEMRGHQKLAVLAALGVCAIAHFGEGRFLNATAQNLDGTDSRSQLFQSAVRNYESGKFVEAEHILLPLLKGSPQAFDANELMGLVLAGERRDTDALAYLKNAVRARPASAPAHVAYGACLLRLGRSAEAEPELQRAGALKPSDYDSNHDLGELYVQIGKLTAAIPFLEKAQGIQPASYDNGYDLALAYLRSQKPRQARDLLRNLIHYKDTAEMHNLLGEAEEGSGDYLAAAKELEKAAHTDPSEGNILDWGTELLRHHTFSAAIEVFTAGVEKYPASVRMELGLGLAYYGFAAHEKSAAALMRACDLAPRDPAPYLILGETYSDSRVPVVGVVDYLDRFIALDPSNAQARYYQALALWKGQSGVPGSKDLSPVEAALEKAASLDPKFGPARLQLGNLYSDENKVPEAVTAYQEALRIDPDLADAHYHLAQLYRRTGKSGAAATELALYQRLHQEQLTEKEEKHKRILRFIITMTR